jgi:hypothetical protein
MKLRLENRRSTEEVSRKMGRFEEGRVRGKR